MAALQLAERETERERNRERERERERESWLLYLFVEIPSIAGGRAWSGMAWYGVFLSWERWRLWGGDVEMNYPMI
jgi:hypothetical protein